jgi:Na+/proline symporter
MICYVISTLFSSSLYIYGPGSALVALTDLDEKISICLIGTIATVSTAIGGIKAVIWTDFYQTIIMISSLVIIIVKGLIDIGGFKNMWQINLYGGRLQIFDFNPDPFIRQSFWSQSIGFMLVISFFYSVDQQMIQRFIASKNKKTAQRALLYHMPLIFSFFSLVCLAGLVMYANFFACDIISSKKISNSNQLLGFFVSTNLNGYPGVAGLFLGALICASFSSISSVLSSLSSIIWQDFCMLIPYFQKFNDTKSVFMTKSLVFICGFLGTGFAILLSVIKGNLIILSSSLQGLLIFILNS